MSRFALRRWLAVLLIVLPQCSSFLHYNRFCSFGRERRRPSVSAGMVVRYGPTEPSFRGHRRQRSMNRTVDDGGVIENESERLQTESSERFKRLKKDFRVLLDKVLAVERIEHLPSLMTRDVHLLLSIRGHEGALIFEDAVAEAQKEGGEERANRVAASIEFMIEFLEAFVEETKEIDDHNKHLLGKIIRALTDNRDIVDVSERERLLDQVLEDEKTNFTPGFLRHIEGECERISNAPSMTPDSSRLLETIRIIQARVLEELGKDLGEGAQLLGQLLGFDDRNERLAVLDASLTVRGIDFARELVSLTEEALEGFGRVPKGADPDLVGRVSEMDKRIRQFIDKQILLP